MDERIYKSCVTVLGEELLPAMGCTEPIAVAYAAALARQTLGELPERVEISVSGNILKNVKGVVVPGTGGLKGVIAAAAAGIVAGDAELQLEVISNVSPDGIEKIKEYMLSAEFIVSQSRTDCIFDILVGVAAGAHAAQVRIAGHHTNVVLIRKDGKDILSR